MLLYMDNNIIDFHLNEEKNFGLILNADWLFVYFEFDPLQPWNETTGS